MQVDSKYYKGSYGVNYLIESVGEGAYVLFCITSELKQKKELVFKQAFFRGSFDDSLKYLKTIENNIKELSS